MITLLSIIHIGTAPQEGTIFGYDVLKSFIYYMYTNDNPDYIVLIPWNILC